LKPFGGFYGENCGSDHVNAQLVVRTYWHELDGLKLWLAELDKNFSRILVVWVDGFLFVNRGMAAWVELEFLLCAPSDRGRDSDHRRSEHSSSRREPERDERSRDRGFDGRDLQRHSYPSAVVSSFPPSAPREYYDARGAGARPPPQPHMGGGGGAGGGASGGTGAAHDHGGYRGPSAAARNEHLFCLGCNQRGHWARDCPDPASRGKCFNCQQPGHTARDCPQPRGQRQGQRQGQAPAAHGGYQDRGQPPQVPQQQQPVARGRSRSRSPGRRSPSPRR
jgi:hypothetical protein